MDVSATGRAPPVGVESAINIDVAASSATHSTAGEPLRPDLAAPPPEKAGFSPDPDKQYQYREGELVRVVNDEHERYDQVGFVTSINDEGTVTVEFVDSSVEESASKIQALARGRMVREGKSSGGAATIRSYGQFYLATARMRRQPLVHELWSRGAHRLSVGQPHSESDEGAEFALALADETGDGGEEQEEVLSPRRKRHTGVQQPVVGPEFMLYRRWAGERWMRCGATEGGRQPDSRVHRYEREVGFKSGGGLSDPDASGDAPFSEAERMALCSDRRRSHIQLVARWARFECYCLASHPDEPFTEWLQRIGEAHQGGTEDREALEPPPPPLLQAFSRFCEENYKKNNEHAERFQRI